MDVSSTTSKLYTRAVSPSVEGHARQEKGGQGKEITQNRDAHVKNERAAEAKSAAQKNSETRVNNDQQQRHREVETKQVQNQDTARSGEKSSAAALLLAEQMTAARQTRNNQSPRRSYSPPALTSHRGHRANQSYSANPEKRSGRMLDEMV